MPSDSTIITQWLMQWRNGDQQAGNQLFTTVYDELRRLAAWQMQQERPGHTLQPTALVNELYLKLFGGEPVSWQNRAHFFAVAAQQLRRLLIDYARARQAGKRGGKEPRIPLSSVEGIVAAEPEDLIELDLALTRLEEMDQRSARVVELRIFAGLTEKDAAEALGISVATLKRDWNFARAWLTQQLKSSN